MPSPTASHAIRLRVAALERLEQDVEQRGAEQHARQQAHEVVHDAHQHADRQARRDRDGEQPADRGGGEGSRQASCERARAAKAGPHHATPCALNHASARRQASCAAAAR